MKSRPGRPKLAAHLKRTTKTYSIAKETVSMIALAARSKGVSTGAILDILARKLLVITL